MSLTCRNTRRSVFKWSVCLQPKFKLLETLSNRTPTINVLYRKKQIVISHRKKGGGGALRVSLSSTKTYVNGFCYVWVEVVRPYFTATCTLAFSLPVIVWKTRLTNDCSFAVNFFIRGKSFLGVAAEESFGSWSQLYKMLKGCLVYRASLSLKWNLREGFVIQTADFWLFFYSCSVSAVSGVQI